MAKLRDPRNLTTWQKRLGRYRSSGLTIERFCQHEKVSTGAFYYWSRRLKQEGQVPAIPAAGRGRRRHGSTERRLREPVATVCPQPSSGAGSPATAPMVHFVWNSNLQVSIPAHCLDAIRSVLEWAREGVDESPNASGQTSAFQQVLVGSR